MKSKIIERSTGVVILKNKRYEYVNMILYSVQNNIPYNLYHLSVHFKRYHDRLDVAKIKIAYIMS